MPLPEGPVQGIKRSNRLHLGSLQHPDRHAKENPSNRTDRHGNGDHDQSSAPETLYPKFVEESIGDGHKRKVR
jgi:hypothetical protein